MSKLEPGSDIVVLGTQEGLEARLAPERGYELQTIDRLPFPRRPNGYALKFPAKYARAVKRVRALIRERDIDVVVGFGGYASAPAYRAAYLERVPYVIHEANAKPGLANKQGARRTRYIGVGLRGYPDCACNSDRNATSPRDHDPRPGGASHRGSNSLRP